MNNIVRFSFFHRPLDASHQNHQLALQFIKKNTKYTIRFTI